MRNRERRGRRRSWTLPWIKHWRDWPMRELWSLHRIGPEPQGLRQSYEKAGVTVRDQPIPWNADVVLVEGVLRLPTALARRKADFHLKLPGQAPLVPDAMRRQDSDD